MGARFKQRFAPLDQARAMFAAMFLTGLILIFTTGIAFGQSIGGGCSGTANGQQPTQLTPQNPLVVAPGEQIRIAGKAPGNPRGRTVVDYNLALVDPIGKVKADAELHGRGRNWRGSVNVDQYLSIGSGLYRVTGNVTTTQGSYNCPVSFYVFLDGNKLIGVGGIVMGGAGALGILTSGRGKPPTGQGRSSGYKPDRPAKLRKEGTTACGVVILFGLIASTGLFAPVFPVQSLADAELASKRIWAKGRPVFGFFSGLIMGLGGVVALQQFGFVTLNVKSLIVAPLLTAVLGAYNGWRGTPYKPEDEEQASPPPEG